MVLYLIGILVFTVCLLVFLGYASAKGGRIEQDTEEVLGVLIVFIIAWPLILVLLITLGPLYALGYYIYIKSKTIFTALDSTEKEKE